MFLSQNIIIIANAISIVGLVFFFISSFMKNRRNVALAQIGCSGLNFIAWFLLGAYSAAVQDAVSVLRNSVVVLKKQNKVLDIIFIVLALSLGIVFNVDAFRPGEERILYYYHPDGSKQEVGRLIFEELEETEDHGIII